MKKSRPSNLKAALTNSLKAEDSAVRDRFERAESLLGQTPKPEAPATNNPPPVERKQKTIRDSFTMPEEDAKLLGVLQERCLTALSLATNKSELIRAGLHALMQMDDVDLKQVLDGLEKIKTGRPAQQK
jgi:hypothetical protein